MNHDLLAVASDAGQRKNKPVALCKNNVQKVYHCRLFQQCHPSGNLQCFLQSLPVSIVRRRNR